MKKLLFLFFFSQTIFAAQEEFDFALLNDQEYAQEMQLLLDEIRTLEWITAREQEFDDKEQLRLIEKQLERQRWFNNHFIQMAQGLNDVLRERSKRAFSNYLERMLHENQTQGRTSSCNYNKTKNR